MPNSVRTARRRRQRFSIDLRTMGVDPAFILIPGFCLLLLFIKKADDLPTVAQIGESLDQLWQSVLWIVGVAAVLSGWLMVDSWGNGRR